MKLIRADKDGVRVFEDPPIAFTPLPPELRQRMRALIDSPEEAARIEEMHRRHMIGAAILAPMPVGGEDEYEKRRGS
jgi:hypothetical protein